MATFLIPVILSLYISLSYSAIQCSFHHPEELGSPATHHAASGNSHHHPLSPSKEFCKYAHSLSPVIYTVSTHYFVFFHQTEVPFLNVPSLTIKEHEDEHFQRGPPVLV